MTTAAASGSARLRANPAYELVILDRLPPDERALVARDGAGDGELYGVLRPRRGSGLEARTASADVALLFLSLAEPAPLPAYARSLLGADAQRTTAQLVLDGILELEHAGAFHSGAAAGPLLLGDGDDAARGGSGRVGELSEAALRYGQELTALPAELLARRLYAYGTAPVSPRLRQRLGDEAALASAAGLDAGGPAAAALAAGWIARPAAAGRRAHWRHWSARGAADGAGTWKLYVSPRLDALPAAVTAVAEELAGPGGALAFKLGGDVHGLCRPDKLVAYFDRLDDLRACADRLRGRLAGCLAQGVPFTAAVTADGLLSWGADPPPRAGEAPSSWRMWIAQRLAEELRAAGDGDLEPWQFALRRLRLGGVDTDSWIPATAASPEALAR